ncbi:hypothetical protein L218DRAFT_372838 [Marasmius fiardii PR-910]|nr:hypothetical protein L218DRAFT_372838 [Marasmius fiardii PR-910]
MLDNRDRQGNSSSGTSIVSSIFNSTDDVTVSSAWDSIDEDEDEETEEFECETRYDCPSDPSTSQPGSPKNVPLHHHDTSPLVLYHWHEPGWTDEIPLEVIEAALEEEKYLAYEDVEGDEADESLSLPDDYERVPVPEYPLPPESSRFLDRPILNLALAKGNGRNPTRVKEGCSNMELTPSSIAGTPPVASALTLQCHEGTDDKPSQFSLPVPSHAVLGHLCTSAIKNGVVGLASTSRYRGKFMTTIYYRPLT